MGNKTELLARLRGELGDTGGSTIWSDTLLGELLDEAVDWYSRLFPMRADAYRDVADGARTFSVPAGAISVIQVECPPGVPIPREASGTTGSTGTTGKRQGWNQWGGFVYLTNPASGNEVGTGHLIMRLLLPWPRLDPSDDWDGPETDERLLLVWSTAEAWAWLDGQDRKRGRSSSAGLMTARYTAQLERELEARGRAASSRTLESDQ